MIERRDPSRVQWQEGCSRATGTLRTTGVVAVRRGLDAVDCERWAHGTYDGRAEWTADFGDDQFSLGRAFYTHLEQGRSATYFKDAAASDARVERYAPGLQAAMHALAVTLTGGNVRPRRGWCGAGIHIFPAEAHVARHGGVIHFDTEGLTEHHIAARGRAMSIVCMLQPPTGGGGLRIWELSFDGDDAPPERAGEAPSVMAEYRAGDVVAFDSYRLHQIQPFVGDRDRVSATLHLAEIDAGHWESWF